MFDLFLEIRVNREHAKAFKKANGGYFRGAEWKDLIIEAYII